MTPLRNKVFIQILIPTVIIFLCIFLTAIYFIDNTYKEQRISYKTLEIEKASRAINDWFLFRMSEMVLLSRTELLKRGAMPEIKAFLKEEQDRLSFIYNRIWYIEPSSVYWNTENETGKFLADTSLLKALLSRESYFQYKAPLKLDGPNDQPVVFLAIPVLLGEKARAVLGASILISWFRRIIGYFTYDVFEEVMLVNPSGTIIIHSEQKYEGQKEQAVYNRIFTTNIEWGQDTFFVAVLRNSWKLVGRINNNALYSPLNAINNLFLLSAGVLLLILFIISIWISRRVSRPINILTGTVNRMMQGNFNQEIKINTGDELEALASAFNSLNKRLAQIRTDDRFIFLGHLSARMAHETRKPLNIIQLAAQALQKDGKNIKKNTDLIINEVSNADRFIREILDFTKPDRLNLTYRSINDLIDKSAEKYRLISAQKNIQIQIKPCSREIKFFFDLLKIEQVLSNIIENSIEAAAPDGEIIISAFCRDETVTILLEDSGPGINESIRDKIFDPYFSTKENGTGLGLAICYRILMAHGAKIEVLNREPQGARIKIEFPISQPL